MGDLISHPAMFWMLVLLGVVALVWLYRAVCVPWLGVRVHYDSSERLETEDGSAIELRRLGPPEPTTTPSLPPVLVVHGIGFNHRNLDLHPDRSLARHLASLGRDVWLVTLRSGRTRVRLRERARMSFAAMVRHDLPLAVRVVLERTGRRQLDYLGFSMGGMLLFAALGRTVAQTSIRRAVFIGSPAQVLVWPLVGRLARLVTWPRWLPTLWLEVPGQLVAWFAGVLPSFFHRLFLNSRNVPRGFVRLALIEGVRNIPGRLNLDFARWAASGGEVRVDEEPILGALGETEIPALFFAGGADRLAPEAAVECGYRAWAAARPQTPKRFVLCAERAGAAADYGHGDLAFGTHAPEDVYAPAAGFLNEDEAQEKMAPDAPVS